MLTADEGEPRFEVRTARILLSATCFLFFVEIKKKRRKDVGFFETKFKDIFLPEIIS